MKLTWIALTLLAVLLGGCATPQETLVMQQPGGPPQTVAVPKSM